METNSGMTLKSALGVFNGRDHGVPLSADKPVMAEKKWGSVGIRDGTGRNLGEEFGGAGCHRCNQRVQLCNQR